MKRIISLALVGVLLLAACGDDETTDTTESPGDTAAVVDEPTGDAGETILAGSGPGISVAEALAYTGTEPVLVNGYLFVYPDGSVVMADAIAESFPPQPGGAQVGVEGLDLAQIPLTEGPAGGAMTSWTDQQVQLIGSIVDGVFVGNSVASA